MAFCFLPLLSLPSLSQTERQMEMIQGDFCQQQTCKLLMLLNLQFVRSMVPNL